MANLAIIPARGGSKRIPRKNIKPFLGKPIIAYAIETALKSNLFDEVMVSTDDAEIAEIAKQYGASVPFLRSDQNANDHATLYDLVHENLSHEYIKKKSFDVVCCILATSVFVTPNLLKKAFTTIRTDNTDSVLTVTPYAYPIQRALIINEENELNFLNSEYQNQRSQDLDTCYHDAGMFYVTKVKSFLNKNNRKLAAGIIKPIVLKETETQDIDNHEDWKMAEIKYQYNLKLNE